MTPTPAPSSSAKVVSRRACPARRARSPRAFTLIEVLATMVMIAIILPVAMHGISLAMWAADNARHEADAATLAQGKLAEIVESPSLVAGSQGGDFGPDYPGYTWQSTAVSRDYGLLEVDLAVTWTSRGNDRSVTLSTLVYQSGTADTGSTGTTTQ